MDKNLALLKIRAIETFQRKNMDKNLALLKIRAIETFHILNSAKLCKKWGCFICSIIACEKSCPEHYTRGGCPECGKDEQFQLKL